MAFLLLDPRLHPRAAGSILVPEATLERKLGRAAFIVWQILTTRRDAGCLTYAKRTTISTAKGFEKLPDSVVKDALKRLRSAGLVMDMQVRRRRATLPSGETGWVYGRRVYGARAVSPGRTERLVVVPDTTYHWLKMATSWGGSRKGAGRKRVVQDPRESDIANWTRKNVRQAVDRFWKEGKIRRAPGGFPDYGGIIQHLGPCPGARPDYHIDHIKPLSAFNLLDVDQLHEAFAPCNHQWLTARENLSKSINWKPPEGMGAVSRTPIPSQMARIQVPPRITIDPPVKNQQSQEGVGEAVLRTASPTRGAGAPRPGMQPAPSPGMEVSLMLSKPTTPTDPSLGVCLGGTAPRPRLPQPGQMGMPSYPGPTVMPPAMVPRPPKLPEDLSDLDVAQWLAKSYRGAVESRYGGRCYVLAKKSELAKSRFLKVLVDGGRTLADYDIAPAAWAAFSVEVWRRYENTKKPPPINWMFGTNRIEERRGWFEAEEGAYNGGRVVHGEAAQDLMRRYAQMQGALTWAQARTESEVKKVVERFFPNGLYDKLLAKAREQSQDDQRQMNEAVARGEWVWR